MRKSTGYYSVMSPKNNINYITGIYYCNTDNQITSILVLTVV